MSDKTARQFVGAIALVRRDADGGSRWLAQWNPGRQRLQFVEAHKLEGESFRDSLVREIAWATGLRQGKDYIVSSVPRAHLQLQAEPGPDEEAGAIFVVEFYLVELMGRSAVGTLESDDRNRWLAPEEIFSGRAADGALVCETQRMLLSRTEVIQPWEP